MTQEELTRRYWFNRMMNVTARGYNPQAAVWAAGSGRVNPWKWTAVRDCPDQFLAVLNSNNVPYLTYRSAPYAKPPWKGFYTMDRIVVGDMFYDLQLEYGMGDEKSIMLTFDGFPVGSKTPTLLPVVVATKKS